MIYQPPFRLQILQSLTDHLKGVTIANGYQFDLDDEPNGRRRVVRGRLFLGNAEAPNMISIIEPPSAIEPLKARAVDNVNRATEWDLMIQGWAKNQSDMEECDPAYVLVADVQQRLSDLKAQHQPSRRGAPNILGFGPRITDLNIGTPVVRPCEEVNGFGQFFTILTLKIVEDISSPLG